MITKMEVFSAQASAPELQLGGPMAMDDPVIIRDIQGLGPVKAEISTTPFATADGEIYQGASLGKRNIVMSLGLNPNWETQTMSTLRQLLYAYFLPKAWNKLRFYMDYMPTVDIEGYVESFEPNIFSQDPEIQISIICPKPDFVEPSATIIGGVVDDGTIEQEFEYTGTVPAGFEMLIKHSPTLETYSGKFIIMLKSPAVPQQFEVDPISIDDTKYFRMSSVKNNKRVQVINYADGSFLNKLNTMDVLSVWPEMKPGQNVISVIAEENGLGWTMGYFNRYGGL